MISKIFSSYWLIRIYNNLKRNGLRVFIRNSLFFLNRVFNPKILGELPFAAYFEKRRRLIIKLCKKELKNFDNLNIKSFFNYYLDESIIKQNSVIYSFGLSNSINFELDIVKKKNVKVFCYDPTDLSVDYFKKNKFENIFFQPYGLFTEDKEIEFFMSDSGNGSIVEEMLTGDNIKKKKFQCYTLKTLMDKNNHDKIDVLKIDIDGVEKEVLYQMIQDKIYPSQICVEFESPPVDNLEKATDNLNDIKKIIKYIKENNYSAYHMPRFSNKPYDSVEVLFVRKIDN